MLAATESITPILAALGGVITAVGLVFTGIATSRNTQGQANQKASNELIADLREDGKQLREDREKQDTRIDELEQKLIECEKDKRDIERELKACDKDRREAENKLCLLQDELADLGKKQQ